MPTVFRCVCLMCVCECVATAWKRADLLDCAIAITHHTLLNFHVWITINVNAWITRERERKNPADQSDEGKKRRCKSTFISPHEGESERVRFGDKRKKADTFIQMWAQCIADTHPKPNRILIELMNKHFSMVFACVTHCSPSHLYLCLLFVGRLGVVIDIKMYKCAPVPTLSYSKCSSQFYPIRVCRKRGLFQVLLCIEWKCHWRTQPAMVTW